MNEKEKKIQNPRDISAYIHIPFCTHICYYCDFNKVFLTGQPVDAYIAGLLEEIRLTKEQYPSLDTPTIYIGGGTPTALQAAQLDQLLKGIRERLPFQPHNEFTIEANPGDLTAEKVTILKNYGVNRVSMGVQTFDPHLLKKIGRKHTVEDIYQSMRLLEKMNLTNVSIDLIYALPDQTLASFRETLAQALALDLPHYSLYSLILENHTAFMNWVRKGRLHLPDEELAAQMFEESIESMEKAQRKQYEISNFSLPGKESQHNLVYWHNEHYYGFGAGASGYLENIRYKNHGPIQHYLHPLNEQKRPVVEAETLTRQQQMEEELFLGLRKRAGVSKARFAQKFACPLHTVYGATIRQFVAKGYLEEDAQHIRLTKQGMFVGNEVFEGFLLDDYK